MMNSDMFAISPSTFCIEDNNVWGVHAKFNFLFSYNLSTGLVEIYNLYPYAVMGRESQFIGICKFENNVYLVPCWSSRLISYNVEKRTIKVLEDGSNAKGRFGKSFVIGDKLYCIPMYEDFFLVIDIKRGCIERKIPWKHLVSTKEPVIIDSFVFDNRIVCLIKDCSSEVVLLDEKSNITKQLIQNGGEYLKAGCSSKESMFLYNPKAGMIVRYDKNFNIRESINVNTFFSATLNLVNNILILDNVEKAEQSLYYIENKQIELKSRYAEKSPTSCTGMHGLFHYYNEITYYFDRLKNELYVIDKKNLYKLFKIEMNKQKIKDYIKCIIINEDIILENDITKLELFIECI